MKYIYVVGCKVHMDLKVMLFLKAKFKCINYVEFSKQEKAKQLCNMWKTKMYQTYGVWIPIRSWLKPCRNNSTPKTKKPNCEKVKWGHNKYFSCNIWNLFTPMKIPEALHSYKLVQSNISTIWTLPPEYHPLMEEKKL
jgi:hypothetical protein